jgi:hypothetical protein
MLGTFGANEIRTALPADVPPLTLMEWGNFRILRIARRDDTPGAIAMAGERALSMQRLPNQHGLAIGCADLLQIEFLSETVEVRDLPRDPVGWLALCSNGAAVVCSSQDAMGFVSTALISLTDGRELAENALYHDSVGAVQHWRLLRKSQTGSGATLLLDRSPPRQPA